jgi:hypothetical protein
MKGFKFILVAGTLLATPVFGGSFDSSWENDKDLVDKLNDKIEESNRTEPPTKRPTMKPTLSPTVTPTEVSDRQYLHRQKMQKCLIDSFCSL